MNKAVYNTPPVLYARARVFKGLHWCMVLSEQQIYLVQECYRQVEESPHEFAKHYYGKLFELEPRLQALFRNDLDIQGRKLIAMLEVAVNGVKDMGMLVPMLTQLAHRHNDYNVKKSHFSLLNTALHHAFEQHLQQAYTDEHRQAWQTLLDFMVDTMKPEIIN